LCPGDPTYEGPLVGKDYTFYNNEVYGVTDYHACNGAN
jgi:hypothetical protein